VLQQQHRASHQGAVLVQEMVMMMRDFTRTRLMKMTNIHHTRAWMTGITHPMGSMGTEEEEADMIGIAVVVGGGGEGSVGAQDVGEEVEVVEEGRRRKRMACPLGHVYVMCCWSARPLNNSRVHLLVLLGSHPP
jgi:hypothetical protein